VSSYSKPVVRMWQKVFLQLTVNRLRPFLKQGPNFNYKKTCEPHVLANRPAYNFNIVILFYRRRY
jgi:hypothetical protein